MNTTKRMPYSDEAHYDNFSPEEKSKRGRVFQKGGIDGEKEISHFLKKNLKIPNKLMPTNFKFHDMTIKRFKHYVQIKTRVKGKKKQGMKKKDKEKLIKKAERFGYRAVLINTDLGHPKKYTAKYLDTGEKFSYKTLNRRFWKQKRKKKDMIEKEWDLLDKRIAELEKRIYKLKYNDRNY